MYLYRILRQFTKAGASIISPVVAKHVWTLCLPYSTAPEGLLEPDSLYYLLFNQDNEHNTNYIIKARVLGPDSVLNNHPETSNNEFIRPEQREQQKLMLPPPPPGSFKKIIAHPTRTLLTVPTNFDQNLVQASSRLPNYECNMYALFNVYLLLIKVY